MAAKFKKIICEIKLCCKFYCWNRSSSHIPLNLNGLTSLKLLFRDRVLSCMLTLSMLKSAWYWGTSALRGATRILTSISWVRLWNGTTTGRRPQNSGIKPNSIRSRASTCRSKASRSSLSDTVSLLSAWLFWSASEAARRPWWVSDGAPKPRYY